jgi:hypothetical protein
MASKSNRPNADLVALSTKAISNLAAKLRRVHISGHYLPKDLNVDDIYSASSRTRAPLVPADLQLPYILADHNAIYRMNRLAFLPTTEKEFKLVRALYFWSMSQNHAFTVTAARIRYNVFLMLLVLSRPDLQQYTKPGALVFIRTFMAA